MGHRRTEVSISSGASEASPKNVCACSRACSQRLRPAERTSARIGLPSESTSRSHHDKLSSVHMAHHHGFKRVRAEASYRTLLEVRAGRAELAPYLFDRRGGELVANRNVIVVILLSPISPKLTTNFSCNKLSVGCHLLSRGDCRAQAWPAPASLAWSSDRLFRGSTVWV